ncbi:MAG TPA: hypothetical protein VKV16_06600, partial [Solirubrobacteraceae bacterium]|nr:hypothetical protein [Solirubrobacteraceae bacterium]
KLGVRSRSEAAELVLRHELGLGVLAVEAGEEAVPAGGEAVAAGGGGALAGGEDGARERAPMTAGAGAAALPARP